MRSFDYLQNLYKSGAAKKEALFVPKRFDAAGRQAVRKLIHNYRTSFNVPDHEMLKFLRGHLVPDTPKDIINFLRKKIGMPERRFYNISFGSLRDSPELIKHNIDHDKLYRIPEKDILNPSKHGISREALNLLYWTDRNSFNIYGGILPNNSPYESIHNYFLALRRKKYQDLLEFAIKNSIYRKDLIKKLKERPGVYRGFRGETWWDTSQAVQEMSDKYLSDYIKSKAIFVSQHPEITEAYLSERLGSLGDFGKIAVFNDPKLLKFVKATSTPTMGAFIPLRDRLNGKAHVSNLESVFPRVERIYRLPNNSSEAVLPYSTYENYINNPQLVDIYAPLLPNKKHLLKDMRLNELFTEYAGSGSTIPKYYLQESK